MKKLLLGFVAYAAFSGHAHATLVTTASLFSPLLPSGSSTTILAVQGATLGSSAYAGVGYSIAVDAAAINQGQGFVKGAIPSSLHATPVVGVTATNTPTYLSGDFGSTQTNNPNTATCCPPGLAPSRSPFLLRRPLLRCCGARSTPPTALRLTTMPTTL